MEKEVELGTIVEDEQRLYFKQHIATGSFENAQGNARSFDISLGMGNNSPIIVFNKKTFVMSWEKLFKYLEKEDFFKEELEV